VDTEATFEKLKCTKEDLKKFSFNNKTESLQDVVSLLCTCEGQRPDLAQEAYKCLKNAENDTYALLTCQKPVEAVRKTVTAYIQQLQNDMSHYAQVMRSCKQEITGDLAKIESMAGFHACFMPLVCNSETKSAISCINKNHQELHGCEKEIDEMMNCSINKFHKHLWKVINLKSGKSKSGENDDE
jgi:hypothetical protein